MKKTYIQPTTEIHRIAVERCILAASAGQQLGIYNEEVEVESEDVLSRWSSIWDDEDE